MIWVLDYLDDLESDLSVFHRVDDMRAMAASRFFRFVIRLSAYTGVLQARLIEEEEGKKGRQPEAAPVREDPRSTSKPDQKIYIDDIHHNPELMQFMEGPGGR